MATTEMMDVTNCICANLRKASRVVTQVYDAALQPVGLNTGQFTLLATLDKRAYDFETAETMTTVSYDTLPMKGGA